MPEFARVPDIVHTPPVTMTVNYHSDPVLSPDRPTELGLAFYNTTDTEIELTADITPPKDVMFTPRRISFSIKAGERREFDCRAELSPKAVEAASD